MYSKTGNMWIQQVNKHDFYFLNLNIAWCKSLKIINTLPQGPSIKNKATIVIYTLNKNYCTSYNLYSRGVASLSEISIYTVNAKFKWIFE